MIYDAMSRVELLESTSQTNFKDKDSSTDAQALGNWREYEAFRFPFPMHQAALFNDCDAVSQYLHSKHGCYRIDINATDSCGRTITHVCAIESHLMLLLFILERRPNLEIKDCDVRSTLFRRQLVFFVMLANILSFALGLDRFTLGNGSTNSSRVGQCRMSHKSSKSGGS